MASLWMVTGVDKTRTGSLDTYFDSKVNSLDYNYAYIGSANDVTTAYPTTYTWPSGSNEDRSTDRNLQMYTPNPLSERGKLYFVKTDTFSTDNLLPSKDQFVSLNLPEAEGFYVVTPSLNASLLAATFHIAVYAFTDVDDLFANGWRCQSGTPTESSPLTLKETWVSITNNVDWYNLLGLDVNENDPVLKAQARAQVVACTLALTPVAQTMQTALGLSGQTLIKGAVVIAGTGVDPWGGSSFNSYGGIVPFIG
tara:strand:+ start:216 stop:974 length:759 start_codon:yes stop_codon:yes gene_type:complete